MARAIIDRFPVSRMTVTDVDPAMVEMASRSLHAEPRLRVELADATTLPFEDDSFDFVVSFIMLHHVVDWERALHEAVRVLKPGGRLVGYDLVSTRSFEWLHRAEGQPVRLMAIDDVRALFRAAPVEAVVRRGIGGLAARFNVVKAS